jgi:hypothetical protein
MVFVLNFCHLVTLFCKIKAFVLVLIFSINFLPFFVLNKTNLLWHSCPMTKEIQWSQCEMQFILIKLNLFKASIGISNKLHDLEINSYFNLENCYFETENLYFNFEYFYFNMKVHISIWKLLFQSKNLIFNYVKYYMNLTFNPVYII